MTSWSCPLLQQGQTIKTNHAGGKVYRLYSRLTQQLPGVCIFLAEFCSCK